MSGPIGIYIHIPFCVRKCRYCDFLSAPADADTRHLYTEALCNEIRTAGNGRKRLNSGTVPAVDTIFIGGGTPTTLDPRELTMIMDCVRQSFYVMPEAEITMEMNPGTYSEGMLTFVSKYVNRVSIGLQSAQNEELTMLGRIHTYEEFELCYRALRTAGITNINVDLMSALPGQTVSGWEDTLRRVAGLGPEHISAYSLIIEEGTPFYDLYERDELELPGEEEEREMYYLTGQILLENGYRRYEISNYAKPGYACRHNVRYWRRTPYLGFGIGAASMYGELGRISDYTGKPGYQKGMSRCAFESGQAAGGDLSPERLLVFCGQVRRTNVSDLKAYMDRYGRTGDSGDSENGRDDWTGDGSITKELTFREAMEEYMFLGLRMTDGVSESGFLHAFGAEIDDIYGDVLERLVGEGMLERAGDRIALTERGLDVSNVVMAEFLLQA